MASSDDFASKRWGAGLKSLGPAPPAGEPVGHIREFIAIGFGLPLTHSVGEVHRHGGHVDTPLTVEILPPGEGKPLVIRYDEERLARRAETLRGIAAASTNGLTRGDLLHGSKPAQAMFEALCSLAAVYDADDPRDLTWEWLQSLRANAALVTGYTLDRQGRYDALARLQSWPYSRGLVLAAQSALVHRDQDVRVPQPPLLVIEEGRWAGEFIANGHLGVFVRFEMGAEQMPDSKAAGRVLELGGSRHPLQAWNVDRTDKKRLMLVRLPDRPTASADGAEDGETPE